MAGTSKSGGARPGAGRRFNTVELSDEAAQALRLMANEQIKVMGAYATAREIAGQIVETMVLEAWKTIQAGSA